MLTAADLKKHGYKEFVWNGGLIMEYWKPLFKKRGRDVRLAVRFGEYQDRLFLVYIILPEHMLCLKHIQTLAELEALYALLREP